MKAVLLQLPADHNNPTIMGIPEHGNYRMFNALKTRKNQATLRSLSFQGRK